MGIREKWVGCTSSLCVICPISGVRYEETHTAAEQGITRCFYRNGLLPWSGGSWRRQAPFSSLFPLSILSILFGSRGSNPQPQGPPSASLSYSPSHPAPATSSLPLGPSTHPETTAMQLCLFHGKAWSQLCRTRSSCGDCFSPPMNTFKLHGGCPRQKVRWVCLKQCKSCFKPKAEMWLSIRLMWPHPAALLWRETQVHYFTIFPESPRNPLHWRLQTQVLKCWVSETVSEWNFDLQPQWLWKSHRIFETKEGNRKEK